jgi:hypothetical protein
MPRISLPVPWWILSLLALAPARTSAQQQVFPYTENFDAATPPVLPPGWASSRNKAAGTDDFTLSATAPRSAPHCAAATNATLPQELISPVFDFTGFTRGNLGWYTRRSSTFNAAIVCEASIDSGAAYTLQIGDTLLPSGSTSYVASVVQLPAALAGRRRVRFRWRIVPDAAGTSGTLRIDDVTLGDSAVGDSAAAGDIVVNEIMYAPGTGEPEWIEILNLGARPVNLHDWTVADATLVRRSITASEVRLDRYEYCVLTGDSAALRAFDPGIPGRTLQVTGFPALNDAGDCVTIADARGFTIDSVAYLPQWHNPAVQDSRGRSLERIIARGASNDPGNWTSCVLPRGGTPAQPNSAARRPGTSGALLSCNPNPFSPDNDGVDDATVVHYTLPEGIWSVQVKVYDVRGRLIRRLASAVPGVGQGDIVWDGRDDERVHGHIGIYIVMLEAFEQKRGWSVSGKTVVVLAGRLQ